MAKIHVDDYIDKELGRYPNKAKRLRELIFYGQQYERLPEQLKTIAIGDLNSLIDAIKNNSTRLIGLEPATILDQLKNNRFGKDPMASDCVA